MEKYSWKRNGFTFLLEKSESKPLWGDEGVSQLVRLIVTDSEYSNVIIATGFGADYVLDIINQDKINDNDKISTANIINYFYFGKNKFYFIVDTFQEEFIIFDGDDCEDFYDWLIQSLSIMEGRKMKINKIKQKING